MNPKKYKIGITKCLRCKTWKPFYTTKPRTYTSKCYTCKKNTKLKDKQNGGWRQPTKFLKTDKMSIAGHTARQLNKKINPEIQQKIQRVLRLPPNKRPSTTEQILMNQEHQPIFKTYNKNTRKKNND